MFSSTPRKFRHTLAFRLTFWYAGIFMLSSAIAFLCFYFLITSIILERTDQDLYSQVGKFSSILALEGNTAVKNLAIIEAQAAGEKKIFFRLLYPNGGVFSSSNMSYWKNIEVNQTAIDQLSQGVMKVFETIIIPEHKHKIRILYAMIGPGLILQLGQSMENYTRFIEAFKKIFLSTMSILFILAVIIGWFMAKQAISGVEEVTQIAQSITQENLDKRVPIKSKGDEIDQLAVTFNQMLDRIQKLISDIKEMTDNIAHDLKSPITRIRGVAEITLTTETQVDEYQKMAQSTIEECDRLLDMINTMLVISKTEAGVGMLNKEQINIAKIVKDACELFEPMAEDKKINIKCDILNDPIISADKRMIQRLISNLMDNAIKYSNSEGNVRITVTDVDHQHVEISVSDTGIGISAQDIPHIFKRFYRCDPSRSEPGTGLGLSLADTIARAHGGYITVTSKPNIGSIFNIILPHQLLATNHI